MKQGIFLIVMLIPQIAFGAYNCTTEYSSLPNGYSAVGEVALARNCTILNMQSKHIFYCNAANKICDYVLTCAACPSGYTLTRQSGTGNSCMSVPYDTCCKNCTNCVSDTNWTAYGTGYQRKVKRTCNCDGTCSEKYSYQCANGYWGYTTDGNTGCQKCPDNATCSGGNGTGYVCNAGYYNASSGCARCPDSGLFLDKNLTQPAYGTSDIGNNMVSDACFLFGTYYDSTGQIQIDSNCYL